MAHYDPAWPVESDVGLADYTTLQVGGPARYLARPTNQETLLACLRWAQEEGLRCWILGGGSNVVIADEGLPGMVLQYCASWRKVLRESAGEIDLAVAAGHGWDDLVAWTVEQNWAGLECLSGIPGHVGAAPIQNIGAYGQELRETFLAAEVLDLARGEVERWDAVRCAFAYRKSAFQEGPRHRLLVLHIELRLRRGGTPWIRYPALQRALGLEKSSRLEKSSASQPPSPAETASRAPSLQEVREAVLALRRQKAMVLDQGDPNSRSAGSFFVNPLVTAAEAEEAYRRLAPRLQPGEEMPRYPAEEGRVKLSAAWLIERCGLSRGYGSGRVGLSQKHTLALVNRGEATAQEVLDFACLVQSQVQQNCGITLHPEPVFLGFAPQELARLKGSDKR